MSEKNKQLKKNDFLQAVTEEPMERGALVDALAEFDFISSYLDYLTDHFEAQGKILKNEDGTIQRKAGKKAASRELFRVCYNDEEGEEGYELESAVLGDEGALIDNAHFTDEVKEAGWAQTPKAAAKKASSAVFAQYKADVAAIKACLPEED